VTGTLAFLRAFARRDRWMYLWWGIGVAVLYVSQAWSVDGLYKTQAEFDKAAATMEGNAALIAMAGPARALNTTGGQVTWQAAAFGAVCAGLMSMFVIGRHTRAEEETGRDELLRAAPVGRYAAMSAALLDALLANVLLGILVFGSLAAYGLRVQDSLGLGVGLTLTGWFFSATALVAAQLTASNRAAYGLAGVTLGVAYALRAIGDVSSPVLSWISPIGCAGGPHSSLCSRRWSWWRSPGPSSTGATSAPVSWRPGQDRPGPATGWPAGSGWPGGCSARRWWAGRSGCCSGGWRSGAWATA
jgi:ABC-2 type transport system permease protein